MASLKVFVLSIIFAVLILISCNVSARHLGETISTQQKQSVMQTNGGDYNDPPPYGDPNVPKPPAYGDPNVPKPPAYGDPNQPNPCYDPTC